MDIFAVNPHLYIEKDASGRLVFKGKHVFLQRHRIKEAGARWDSTSKIWAFGTSDADVQAKVRHIMEEVAKYYLDKEDQKEPANESEPSAPARKRKREGSSSKSKRERSKKRTTKKSNKKKVSKPEPKPKPSGVLPDLISQFGLSEGKLKEMDMDFQKKLLEALRTSPCCCISLEDVVENGRVLPNVAIIWKKSTKHVFIFQGKVLATWFSNINSWKNPATNEVLDANNVLIQIS